MIREPSIVHSSFSGAQARARREGMSLDMINKEIRNHEVFRKLGIRIDNRELNGMIVAAMDSNDVGISPSGLATLSPASVITPVQFLQNWLPGIVHYLTTPRLIDELIGVQTVGEWEDEMIVQQIMEPAGNARVYGDYTNVPYTSWNATYDTRTVVRFELGLSVGVLEEKRAARVRITSSGEKRANVTLGLEIQRNRVGFYGFNDGAGQTYGFLNDPNLPAYVNANAGASTSPLWSTKTFNEITADIRQGLAALQNQSFGIINPKRDAITMAIPVFNDQFLTVTTDLGGYSVQEWIDRTYKTLSIEIAPELNDANGGVSGTYFYADRIADASTDGGLVFAHVCPTKFMALGVERHSKNYIEDYSNATAGVLTKRPWAVYRLSGC